MEDLMRYMRNSMNGEHFTESTIVFWFKDVDYKAENNVVEYLGEY